MRTKDRLQPGFASTGSHRRASEKRATRQTTQLEITRETPESNPFFKTEPEHRKMARSKASLKTDPTTTKAAAKTHD
jgi:hypothetical protein